MIILLQVLFSDINAYEVSGLTIFALNLDYLIIF